MIGIALITNDKRKGAQLVFRYPNVIEREDQALLDPLTETIEVIGISPEQSALGNPNTFEFNLIDADLLAKLFKPKAQLWNKLLQVSIDTTICISFPMSVHQEEDNSDSLLGTRYEIDFFNVVLAVSSQDLESLPFQDDAQQQQAATPETTLAGGASYRAAAQTQAQNCHNKLHKYCKIVEEIARAFLHEEKRCEYVSVEAQKMIRIQERLKEELKLGKLGEAFQNSGQTIVDLMVEQSSLANDLKTIFHGLCEGQAVHLYLNRWLSLSFFIHDALANFDITTLRPYHTLLLLKTSTQILNALPKDGSAVIIEVVQASNPLLSFLDLSAELEIPITQLYRIAAHLVYWGFARIIHTVCSTNVYQPSPGTVLLPQSPLAMEFKHRFPSRSLTQVLSQFGPLKSIDKLLESSRDGLHLEIISMVIWLLQHGFLQQLHQFLYFKTPLAAGDECLIELSNDSLNTAGFIGSFEPSFLNNHVPGMVSPSPNKTSSTAALKLELSPSEVQYLSGMRTKIALNSREEQLFHIFLRLCPFLKGKFHVTEIVWRELVTVEQLNEIQSLQLFSECLVSIWLVS